MQKLEDLLLARRTLEDARTQLSYLRRHSLIDDREYQAAMAALATAIAKVTAAVNDQLLVR